MKTICSYYGGSLSYGLATPTSDKDERGIFIHVDISKIIGLNRHDHESKLNKGTGEDIFYWELRHFLNLLNKGNTQALEIMWNNNWINKTIEFDLIQESRNHLVDSHKLFKCLKGYAYGERDLTNGKRTGVLGGKRREHLETYGFSYKNLVQFLRLCRAGEIFFQTGEFPVNIRNDEIGDLLFDIKTNPANYTKEQANQLMDEWEQKLNHSYDNIKVVYGFNEDLANELIYFIYNPVIKEYGEKLIFRKMMENLKT